MADSPMAIYWQSGGLWYAQEQGVCGRETIGGYVTKEALFADAARLFGANVRMEKGEDDD